jgi:hypothetical protein
MSGKSNIYEFEQAENFSRLSTVKLFGILQVRKCDLVVLGIILCVGIPLFLDRCNCFHEANTRAEVSQETSSMRLLAEAISSYKKDHGKFPEPDLTSLTIRTAYIPSLPADPFATKAGATFGYAVKDNGTTQTSFALYSPGPDGDLDYDWQNYPSNGNQPDETLIFATYDPTNGTESSGDIFHIEPTDAATSVSLR